MTQAAPIDAFKAARLEKALSLVSTRVWIARGEEPLGPSKVVPLGWPEFEAVLPDGGFPQGSVVELTASGALGGLTRVALFAVRGAQARDPRGWSAWLDPEGSLYAPGVKKAGIDLERLLVVRPPRRDVGPIAVKLAQARAFDVIVVDESPSCLLRAQPSSMSPVRRQTVRKEVLARKLALLAEEGGSTIIVLTDKSAKRPVPWPVALRVELTRLPGALMVNVVKDRFCRLGSAKIAWRNAYS